MKYRDHGPMVQSPEVEAVLFTPAPRSTRGRVECVVCGAIGFPGGMWQQPHRRGHGPCLDCGRQLTLRLDGSHRKHSRCPKAPR